MTCGMNFVFVCDGVCKHVFEEAATCVPVHVVATHPLPLDQSEAANHGRVMMRFTSVCVCVRLRLWDVLHFSVCLCKRERARVLETSKQFSVMLDFCINIIYFLRLKVP